MKTIYVIYTDGLEEEISCTDWNVRDGVLTITLNNVTRKYQYIPLTSIRTWGTR